ncbi:MAG: ECF transporter S component [Ruminococcaceae bacterium]|nr:ECF transporter S component [Oscillospiraceae bacterium]
MQKKSNKSVKVLVTTAMMSALATVLMLIVRFSILPGAKFLEYDMGDIPVILSTLFLGLPYGSFVLVFVSLIQSLTVSAASSWQGFIMHVVSTGCYIIILKLFMRKKDDAKHLLYGVITATAGLTLIMIPLNLIFTPLYLHTTVEAVAELLIPAIIPFNFIKGVINSVLTFVIYKPLKDGLNKSKLLTK